jgi:hypothetical protein
LPSEAYEIIIADIRIAAAKLSVIEVPSFEHSRIHGVSNLSAFGDGLRVLRTVLYERFIAPPTSPDCPPVTS